MKKLLPIIFSVLIFFASVASAQVQIQGQWVKDIIVTDGVWTDSRAYATLNAAVTAVGATNQTILIPSVQVVTALTIPANVTLQFIRDGAIANSGQLTINTTRIIAEDRQIFTGAGDIDFVAGSTVRSSWFADLHAAVDVTADDTLTLVISEADNVDADMALGNNVTLRWESPFIITSDAGFTFSNIKNIEAGSYQIFAGAGQFNFIAGTVLRSSWFVDLRRADEFTDDDNVDLTILIDQSETIDIDTTFDIYQELKVLHGALITVTAGDTLTIEGLLQLNGSITIGAGGGLVISGSMDLVGDVSGDGTFTIETAGAVRCLKGLISVNGAITINGLIEAGIYHIFNGTGTVSFGNIKIEKVYPQWWGAVADGVTDDTTKIQEAIDSISTYGGRVHFPKGVYYLSATLVIRNTLTIRSAYGISITGDGFQSCLYMPAGANDILNLQYYGDAAENRPVAGFYLGHISFYGATTGKAIYAQRVIRSLFEYVWIRTGGIGIHLYGAENNTFNNLIIGGSVPTEYRPGYAIGAPVNGAVGAINTYGLKLEQDLTAGLIAGTQITSENTFNGLAVENCTNDGIWLATTFNNVFNGTSKGHTGYAIRAGNAYNDEFNLFIEACTGADAGYGAGGGTTALYVSGSGGCIFKVFADAQKLRLLGGAFGNSFIGSVFEDVIQETDGINNFLMCRVDNSFTIPAGQTGQNLVGLVSDGAGTVASITGNTLWDSNRGQYKVYNGTYWYYYGQMVISPETVDFTVEITDSNTSFINNTAAGTIVGSLPDAVPGYGPYEFTVTEPASQDIRVEPLGADTIEGGAPGKYLLLDTRGESATLKCVGAGIWSIVASYGTLSYEP